MPCKIPCEPSGITWNGVKLVRCMEGKFEGVLHQPCKVCLATQKRPTGGDAAIARRLAELERFFRRY